MSAAGMTAPLRPLVTGIDHVVVAVADLDAAAAQWAALGFTVSPRGFHGEAAGTANHTLMLGQGYIELLGVVQPTAANAWLRAALAAGRSLCAVAVATPDAQALHAAWQADGLAVQPAQHFVRAVTRPHGVEQARFTTIDLAPNALPGADLFACQQHTPQWVWLPELMQHANRATALAGVGLEMPASGLHEWARAFGMAAPAQGVLWMGDAGAPLSAPPQRLLAAGRATVIVRRAGGVWPASAQAPEAAASHALDGLNLIFEDTT
jgi:hypothetical protein